MYPFYFGIGGLAPFGVLVYFMIVADTGFVTKGIVLLTFLSTIVMQAAVPPESVPLIPPVSQSLAWMVIRIAFAVVLLVWLKKDELGL